ncbi:hypothetical protein LCGC14_1096660 [marine sediment metagenome]|uniref:ribose-phosphate diphosphokinase n=1 Tax=marine sediment metagenome TaxID=412755 RepID=A0A0F9PTX4_9ZZZZ
MSHGVKKDVMVFSGSSNPELAKAVATDLGIKLGEVDISRFSNGETYVRFMQSIRGHDLFLIQTLANNVNDALMELLIMIDAAKRASADAITVIIPHYGYSRQDKKTKAREPIAAKLVADVLSVAGIDRLVSVDLHAGSIQGFFDVPVDHLTAVSELSDYFKSKKLDNLVVVSPDVGRVKTAKKFADFLDADLAILHKVRPNHNTAEVHHVVGEVEGKAALLIDDMVDTGGTIVEAANAVKKNGATDVYVAATHPVLSGPAIERLKKADIKEMVFTDTIPIPKEKMLPNMKVLSLASLIALTIKNIHEDGSVSSLFRGDV